MYRTQNASSPEQLSTCVSPQRRLADALENARQNVLSPQCFFSASCRPVGRNTSETHTSLLCSLRDLRDLSSTHRTGPQSREPNGRIAAILSIVHFGDIFIQMLMCVSQDPSHNLSGRPGQEKDSFPSQLALPKEETQDLATDSQTHLFFSCL